MKTAQDFTDEEKLEIIAETDKLSLKDVADEYGTSPETVMYLRYGYAPKKGIAISKKDTVLSKAYDSGLRKIKDLTDEERVAIIHRSDEIGIQETAKEFNVSVRTVGYCRVEYARRKGITVRNLLKNKSESSVPTYIPASVSASTHVPLIETAMATTVTANKNAAADFDEIMFDGKTANGIRTDIAGDGIIDNKANKANKAADSVSAANVGHAVNVPAVNSTVYNANASNASDVSSSVQETAGNGIFDDEKSALIMENVLLKERISNMEEQLKKFRKVVEALL